MTADPYADLVIPDLTDDPDARPTYEAQVARAALQLRIRDEARAVYETQKAATNPAQSFDDGLLTEILARPAEPAHRVEGLIPTDAGTLVVAQRKVGKTTWNLNLTRALITGDDFLGTFPVRPVTGRVAILNFEVSAAQLARWAHEALVPADRLYLVNLRGRRNPLTHPADRAELADRLRAHRVETLFVDPFGRAYTGKSQNDPGEVSAWLTDLDTFARSEAGIGDLILNAHAGWDGERTRGASALEDWADSIITLTRGRDDDTNRYMRAIGRDIDIDEDALTFDPHTRTLTMAGTGSRRAKAAQDKSEELVEPVVDIVNRDPGINTKSIHLALKAAGHGVQANDASRAARRAAELGHITIFDLGTGKEKKHYPKTPPPTPSKPPPPEPPNTPSDPLL